MCEEEGKVCVKGWCGGDAVCAWWEHAVVSTNTNVHKASTDLIYHIFLHLTI